MNERCQSGLSRSSRDKPNQYGDEKAPGWERASLVKAALIGVFMFASFIVEADKSLAFNVVPAPECGLSSNASHFVDVYEPSNKMQTQGRDPMRFCIGVPSYAVFVEIHKGPFLSGCKYLIEGLQVISPSRYWSDQQSKTVLNQFEIGNAFDDSGRCLADVDYHQLYGDLRSIRLARSISLPQNQLRAVRGSKFPISKIKFVSSELYGIISDAPQFFRRIPQTSGENGENDSENSRDGFTVFVEKVNYTDKGDEQGAGQRGAFLLFLSIAAAAGIGAYWVARKQ